MKKGFIKCVAMYFAAGSLCYYFSGCHQATAGNEQRPDKNTVIVKVNDSLQVQNDITGFLRWYRDNYKKANSFPLLGKDSDDNFMVNKAAYTDYLNFLSSSHFMSSRYIGYWKTFFIDKEKDLRKEKISSDIPDGFDMDLVLITQEPDVILNKIDSIRYTITSMNDSVALVGLSLPVDSTIAYEFEMYKGSQQWQIGYISTPNYD